VKNLHSSQHNHRTHNNIKCNGSESSQLRKVERGGQRRHVETSENEHSSQHNHRTLNNIRCDRSESSQLRKVKEVSQLRKVKEVESEDTWRRLRMSIRLTTTGRRTKSSAMLHNQLSIDSNLLRNRFAFAVHSIHYRFAIGVQSLRNRCVIAFNSHHSIVPFHELDRRPLVHWLRPVLLAVLVQ
jgi:hypothetical protein